MATNRITWNANGSVSGQFVTVSKLRNVISSLQAARDAMSELNLVVAKYNGDTTSLGTDLGASAADAATLTNLITQANNELNGLASTQISVGATTGTRQLVDALG